MGLSAPRYAGRHSRDLGVRREESRGALEDVALLLDALAELAQIVALGAGQPVVALAAVRVVLTLRAARTVCRSPHLAPRAPQSCSRAPGRGSTSVQMPE